ncbi:MAG: DUF4332 domain-containing protein [Burkholderiaceae bacterium]
MPQERGLIGPTSVLAVGVPSGIHSKSSNQKPDDTQQVDVRLAGDIAAGPETPTIGGQHKPVIADDNQPGPPADAGAVSEVGADFRANDSVQAQVNKSAQASDDATSKGSVPEARSGDSSANTVNSLGSPGAATGQVTGTAATAATVIAGAGSDAGATVKKPEDGNKPAGHGKDDLTRIKGIGMKTSRLLNKNGIRTYAAVAAKSPADLKKILSDVGPMFASNDPSSWPEQAELAMAGKWRQIDDEFGSNGMRISAGVAESAGLQFLPESSKLENSSVSTEPTSTTSPTDAAKGGSPAATPAASTPGNLPVHSDGTKTRAADSSIGGVVRDDLTRIVGVGPKASQLLRSAGITSFADLAAADQQHLAGVLKDGGSRYVLLDPSDWPAQARLAADNQWDALAAMQQGMTPPSALAATTSDRGSTGADDLTKIEGIGPKIADVFKQQGVSRFAELAQIPLPRLQEILKQAGPRFALADPGTWSDQAELAAAGRWAELRKLQDELDGGRRV